MPDGLLAHSWPTMAGTMRALAAVAAFFAAGLASALAADRPGILEIRAEIGTAAAQAQRANLGAFGARDDRGWLERFYSPRAYAPAWSEAGRAHPAALLAIAQLQGAPARGLVPADYGADRLELERRRLVAGPHPDLELARFDVSLTLAVLHYLADSHLGRLRSAYTDLPFAVRVLAFDPVEQLRVALAHDTLAQMFSVAEPGFPIYRQLAAVLARYRQLAAQPAVPLPGLPKATRKVEPGGPYPGASALRERLLLLGDLPADAPPVAGDRYERALADGVIRFQDRHGLLPDGILGTQTLSALNVPLAARVRQIELSMERLRWLPYFPDGPLIAVNIPSFRLWALDEGTSSREPALSMRVIVGQALRTQTPAFVGEMRYIEFNPYWNVPPSIARGEIIPKLQRDPGYLERNDMEFVGSGKGGAVSTTVDEATLAALGAGKLRVRQRPGATNALGTIKFGLPNSENIYLHSTPAKQLFARSRRDFSHGCIRLENPAALAKFLLRGLPEWSPERIEAEMVPGQTRTVSLPAPVPVVMFYTTAIADHDGRALFVEDVYRLDETAASALTRRSEALSAYWSLRH